MAFARSQFDFSFLALRTDYGPPGIHHLLCPGSEEVPVTLEDTGILSGPAEGCLDLAQFFERHR